RLPGRASPWLPRLQGPALRDRGRAAGRPLERAAPRAQGPTQRSAGRTGAEQQELAHNLRAAAFTCNSPPPIVGKTPPALIVSPASSRNYRYVPTRGATGLRRPADP